VLRSDTAKHQKFLFSTLSKSIIKFKEIVIRTYLCYWVMSGEGVLKPKPPEEIDELVCGGVWGAADGRPRLLRMASVGVASLRSFDLIMVCSRTHCAIFGTFSGSI
jgi:hypothetical protein